MPTALFFPFFSLPIFDSSEVFVGLFRLPLSGLFAILGGSLWSITISSVYTSISHKNPKSIWQYLPILLFHRCSNTYAWIPFPYLFTPNWPPLMGTPSSSLRPLIFQSLSKIELHFMPLRRIAQIALVFFQDFLFWQSAGYDEFSAKLLFPFLRAPSTLFSLSLLSHNIFLRLTIIRTFPQAL